MTLTANMPKMLCNRFQLWEKVVTHAKNFTWHSKFVVFTNGYLPVIMRNKTWGDYKVMTQWGKEIK